MLAQDEFVAARRRDWEELERLAARGPLARLDGRAIGRTAALYRSLCADLMRARAAKYDGELLAYLDGLAGQVHNALYTAPPYRLRAVVDLFARDFPSTLRRRWRFLAVAAALFLVPGTVAFVGSLRSRSFAAQLLPEESLSQLERSHSEGFAEGRDSGRDTAMAGFYVWNNVGIAFRCFATGILLGLGSAFFLFYNGIAIGATFGLVTRAGNAHNIFTFCCGHAAFELTAIVISGAAGLQMGYALVATRGRTRLGSLRAQARELAHLILGAAAMLLLAAGIEGYWSPSSVPAPVKWLFAACAWILVVGYLALAGAESRPGRPPRLERREPA